MAKSVISIVFSLIKDYHLRNSIACPMFVADFVHIWTGKYGKTGRGKYIFSFVRREPNLC